MAALRYLTLKNCFTHKNFHHEFSNGLTAITGPNGRGKSLIQEMVRYALFGSKALRSAASRYPKDMRVELGIQLGEDTYVIVRSKTDQTLARNGEIVASGTKVLDKKIPELLGYNLAVFDVANCAKQGELEILSRMKPTERRTMVDNVIGLNIIDDLKVKVGDQAKELKGKVELLEAQTATEAPVKPAEPEGYKPAAFLDTYLKDLRAGKSELDQIAGALSNPAAPAGAKPELDGYLENWTIEKLNQYITAEQQVEKEYHQLNAMFEICVEPTMTREEITAGFAEIAAEKAYLDAQAELARYVEPRYTEGQLIAAEAACISGQLFLQAEGWRKELAAKEAHYVTCPECMHKFAPGEEERVAELKQLLSNPEIPAALPELILPYHDIEPAYKALATWNDPVFQQKLADLKAVPEVRAKHFYADLQRELSYHDQDDAREPHRARWEELDEWYHSTRPNYQQLLRQRQTYELQYQQWQTATQNWDAWLAKKATLEARQRELQHVPAALTQTEEAYKISIAYEYELRQYEERNAAYQRNMKLLAEQRTQLDQFQRAREAVVNIKSTVKKYLVPSLNQVASTLISRMTEGELSNVTVSEEFEITVDDLLINELSGSGEAVANLAIRLALGQVLTNKRFSLFMADEIDGSMDQNRAAYTFQCLRNLDKVISQIVLVSHKSLEADHYVEL